MQNDTFLRWREVRALLKISRSTAWRNERNPSLSFPKRRRLGANSVAWLKSEIDEWISTRKPVAEVERRRA
jgi:prophage regulatory protein